MVEGHRHRAGLDRNHQRGPGRHAFHDAASRDQPRRTASRVARSDDPGGVGHRALFRTRRHPATTLAGARALHRDVLLLDFRRHRLPMPMRCVASPGTNSITAGAAVGIGRVHPRGTRLRVVDRCDRSAPADLGHRRDGDALGLDRALRSSRWRIRREQPGWRRAASLCCATRASSPSCSRRR